MDLELGKTYYFDNCTDDCGTFVKRDGDIILFKPVNNKNYIVDDERDENPGLIGFIDDGTLSNFHLKTN